MRVICILFMVIMLSGLAGVSFWPGWSHGRDQRQVDDSRR
jgi:hypothetical protein